MNLTHAPSDLTDLSYVTGGNCCAHYIIYLFLTRFHHKVITQMEILYCIWQA